MSYHLKGRIEGFFFSRIKSSLLLNMNLSQGYRTHFHVGSQHVSKAWRCMPSPDKVVFLQVPIFKAGSETDLAEPALWTIETT